MSCVQNELLLRQGAVFRMWHEYKNEGQKYRYFIILNRDPQSDKMIVITTTTTQLEKLERKHRDQANPPLVYIHPSEYQDVKEFCVVDCQALKSYKKDELLADMEKREGKFLNLLPETILHKIIKIIDRDTTLPPSIKTLIVE